MFDLLLIRDLVTNPVLVGKDGKLFTCHKFRSMTVPVRQAQGPASWSSVSVAGDSRITPFGATLRHYKLDELPGLWATAEIDDVDNIGPHKEKP